MNPYSKIFPDQLSVVAEAEYKKLMIMEELLELMSKQGISRSELAKRMGVGPSRVTSMLSGSNNFTMETLVRAGRAVGAEFLPHFVPDGHKAHFSTCSAEDIHQAFSVLLRPSPVTKPNSGFIIATSAMKDDAAAA
jgi:transcriptional regulator with XRE-family HTH domain